VDSFFSSNMQESRKRVIHRPEYTHTLSLAREKWILSTESQN
jgi:hypothetical protein